MPHCKGVYDGHSYNLTMGIVVLGQLVAAGWLPHRRYTSLVRGNILFLSEDIYFIDKVSTTYFFAFLT